MYFCSICLDYAKEKGSIATKAASKPERAVTTQKVADKNNCIKSCQTYQKRQN